MNEQDSFNSTRSPYEFKSAKFWCYNCSKEFTKLKLDNESEILCPTCNSVSEEISETDPRFNRPSNINPNSTDFNSSSSSSGGCNSFLSNHFQPEPQTPSNHTNQVEDLPTITQNTENPAEHPPDHITTRRIIIRGRPINRIIDTGERLVIQSEIPLLVVEGENLDGHEAQIIGALLTGLGNPFSPLSIFDILRNDLMNQLIEEFIRNDPNRYGSPPASDDAIAKLKEFKFEFLSEVELNKCTICQDEYVKDDTLLKMECSHDFHKDCLVTWLKQHNTCPVCRKEIEAKRMEEESQQSEAQNETPQDAC